MPGDFVAIVLYERKGLIVPDVLTDIWDKVLRHFQKHHNQYWRNWFEQIEPIGLDNGVLTVGVPELSWQQYLKQVCNANLKEAAQRITGHLITLEYIYTERENWESADLGDIDNDKKTEDLFYYNPDYTFDNFVVGACNRLAHAACIAVSESPGRVYNPLFIHGSVGLGKTHLLQSTCQSLLKYEKHTRIAYLTCETFVNDFIRSI